MKIYKIITIAFILLIISLGTFSFSVKSQNNIEVENNPKGQIENPFKTYYSEPFYLTDMEIDSENNTVYLGCPYGLVVKKLDDEEFRVIAYFDGLDNSFIKALELDTVHSRLFILVKDSNDIFIMDLDSLEITNRIQLNMNSTEYHGQRFEHIYYCLEDEKVFLASDAGVAILDLESNNFEFFDVTKLEMNSSISFIYVNRIDYNSKTSELYIATSEGLSIFNTKTKIFNNFRNDSKLARYIYDLTYIKDKNRLYLGNKEGLFEYDIYSDSITNYPPILNPKDEPRRESTISAVNSMCYDPFRDVLYAFMYNDEALYHRMGKFDLSKSINDSFSWIDDATGKNESTFTILDYNDVENELLIGIGEQKQERSISFGFGKVLFKYNYDLDRFTPITITDHVWIEDNPCDLEIYSKTGMGLFFAHNMITFNLDYSAERHYYSDYVGVGDIVIINDLAYLEAHPGISIMNLTTGDIHQIPHSNLSFCQALDIGEKSGKLYIGKESGIYIYDQKANTTEFYPLEASWGPPNVFGIAVDEDEKNVYLTHTSAFYKLYLSNGTFQLIENTSRYAQVGIHHKLKKIIVNMDERKGSKIDLEGFPKTGTISAFYIEQDLNKLFAVTGMNPIGHGSMSTGYHSPEMSYLYSDSVGGLIIYDFENKDFVNYSADHGLPSNILTGVAYDPIRGLIHITGNRFYTIVNESDLSEGNLRKNVNLKILTPKEKDEIDNNDSVFWASHSIIYLSVSGISLIIIISFIFFIEPSKYKIMAAFAVPYYTRIKKEKVLDHNIRGKIQGYIQSEPGAHYNELKKNLELNNGALSYHLQVLEREGYIKSINGGRYKFFFSRNMKIPKKFFKMSDIQKIIFKNLNETPGISQKKLTEIIGSSTSTVNYNLKILKDKGIVDVKKVGSSTKCYIIQENEESSNDFKMNMEEDSS